MPLLDYNWYVQNVNEPPVKYVHESYIRDNRIFTRLPIDTVPTQKRVSKRFLGEAPEPTWLNIGEEPTTPWSAGLHNYEEGLAYIGDNIDFPIQFAKDDNWAGNKDPKQLQMDLYLHLLGFSIDNYLINNSKVTPSGPGVGDPKGFYGIAYRLKNPSVFGNNPGCSIQASASLATADRSATNGINFQQDMRKLMMHMGSDTGSGMFALFAPQAMWLADSAIKAAGTTGGFDISKDMFARTIRKFDDLDIVSCGLLKPQGAQFIQTSPIIDCAQDINGNSAGDPGYNPVGAVYTTVYFIRTAKGKNAKNDIEDPTTGLSMWQQYDQKIRKYDELPGLRTGRYMIDTSTGLWNPGTFDIGRIYGIKTDGPTGN